MRITPITTQNNYKKTNFQSKLPGLNFKYTKGYEDYWDEFGKECIFNGYGSRLRQALEKLKSNSDNNLLALTYHSIFEKKGSIDYTATSTYMFSLHPNSESKSIEMDKKLNFRNVTVTITEEHEQEKHGLQRIFSSRTLSAFPKDIEHSKDDKPFKVILKALESIVEKGTKANNMIFREKVNFVDEYRV